jgi:hypothetical protein
MRTQGGCPRLRSAMRGSCEGLAIVIPGWSQRVGASRRPMTGSGPDPESRDSGFDASHRPGMTVSGLPGRFAPCKTVIPCACGYPVRRSFCDSTIGASEYWIARFRGRRRLRVWRSHTHKTRLHDLAARCARVVDKSLAPMEGVGNAGCPLHPRPRVHLVLVERTRVTTSTPESPGIPARNGFNGL